MCLTLKVMVKDVILHNGGQRNVFAVRIMFKVKVIALNRNSTNLKPFTQATLCYNLATLYSLGTDIYVEM